MAGPFYVDSVSGGDTDGLSWANAWISPNSLPTLASGEIVYVANDSVDAFGYSGNKTWTGPTSGAPAIIISVTSGTTTYVRSTTAQFNVVGASYNAGFDGSFALYGIKVVAGQNINYYSDGDETTYLYEVTSKPGYGDSITLGTSETNVRADRCELDLSGTNSSYSTTTTITLNGAVEVNELTVTNGSNRSGALFTPGTNTDSLIVNGLDMASCTHASGMDICKFSGILYCPILITNVLTPSSFSVTSGALTRVSPRLVARNCGNTTASTFFYVKSYFGEVTSSTSIYRTGGASFSGTTSSWQIMTTAYASIDTAFSTPWIYKDITATGTYEVSLYITHDANPAGDFDDDEVWLEVMFKDDATSEFLTLDSDRIATRTTTPAPQADDTGSTWNGSGPSYTYMQKLSVPSLTIGTTGLLRARVCVAVPSIVSGNYFYIDPAITVA